MTKRQHDRTYNELKRKNTVVFMAGGQRRVILRLQPGESHVARAERAGITVGGYNSADGSVRLAEGLGWRGEVRFF